MYSWEQDNLNDKTKKLAAALKKNMELEQRIEDMTRDMETQKKTIRLQSETVDILNDKNEALHKRLRVINRICADLLEKIDHVENEIDQASFNIMLTGEDNAPLEHFPRVVK